MGRSLCIRDYDTTLTGGSLCARQTLEQQTRPRYEIQTLRCTLVHCTYQWVEEGLGSVNLGLQQQPFVADGDG